MLSSKNGVPSIEAYLEILVAACAFPNLIDNGRTINSDYFIAIGRTITTNA